MTLQAIDITKDFPESRERAVLLEMLKVIRVLKAEGIDAVICGGWVPFLKELARDSRSTHMMSFDIDVLLREKARERESIDRIKYLISTPLDFKPSKTASFTYEKTVDGNLVQLDLLADLPRLREDESVLKFYGSETSLELCLVDGAEDLNDHVETIYISCREGEEVETFELTVPDCVGFLMLKTAVCKFREKPKDSYDIYYYCRYSEEPSVIKQRLAQFAVEPAVGATINSLKTNFSHEDSKWVEMVLDHMEITDANDRDQEARLIVRTIGQVIPLIP
jgi:hypothetical protein